MFLLKQQLCVKSVTNLDTVPTTVTIDLIRTPVDVVDVGGHVVVEVVADTVITEEASINNQQIGGRLKVLEDTVQISLIVMALGILILELGFLILGEMFQRIFDSRIFGEYGSHDNKSPLGYDIPNNGFSSGILGPSPSMVNAFGPNSGDSGVGSGFGPSHFVNWAHSATGSSAGSSSSGPANSNTSTGLANSNVTGHFGLVADLSSACDLVDSWIPDSGASAHMTASRDSSSTTRVVVLISCIR
ncbi:hypothetical protein HanIR_Chr16g0831651 [Helianthus annuus]|nr:hypothetical protein HanIR_Chr16g0831651 [Helianthus annuus]